jgi:hypothetical protein
MSHNENLAQVHLPEPIFMTDIVLDQQAEQSIVEKNGSSKIGRLMVLGLAVGSVFGLVSEAADSDTPEAHADYRCAVADYYVTVDIYDAAGNWIGQRDEGWCYGSPSPTPTNPPNTQPPTNPPSNGRGGGNSGGGNTGGGGGTTATTIPYGNRDNDGDGINNSNDNCDDLSNPGQENFDSDADGDACDIDMDGDTYPNQGGVYFNDADDLSPGIGEAGVEQARVNNIDVDSGSEEANLNRVVAFTVNPNDWQRTIDNYAAYGVEVMTATTTTTSIPETSTTAPIGTTTTEELETSTSVAEIIDTTIPTTEAVEPSTTELEVVPVANDSDGDKDSMLPIGLGIAGLAGFAGLAVYVSRKRNHSASPSAA